VGVGLVLVVEVCVGLLEFSLTLGGKKKELLSDNPCISEIRLYTSGTFAVSILYSPVREWN
jgi:hypothetical protein